MLYKKWVESSMGERQGGLRGDKEFGSYLACCSLLSSMNRFIFYQMNSKERTSSKTLLQLYCHVEKWLEERIEGNHTSMDSEGEIGKMVQVGINK